MGLFLKHIIRQLLILTLIAQTLNLSCSSVDFYLQSENRTSDNVDFVDSIVEYVVENVCGFSSHTFQDKADTNNTNKQIQANIHFDLKYNPSGFVEFRHSHTTIINDNYIPYNELFKELYFIEVPVKPPQVI